MFFGIFTDGDDFTVCSVLNEFPITSIQQASDCFRMGRLITHFRRISGPEIPSSAPASSSNMDYSSINSLSLAGITKRAKLATTISHTTLIQTLKMTISYVKSVYRRTNPVSVKPNKLTN